MKKEYIQPQTEINMLSMGAIMWPGASIVCSATPDNIEAGAPGRRIAHDIYA